MTKQLTNSTMMQRVGVAAAAGVVPVVSDAIKLDKANGVLFGVVMGTIVATGVVTIKAEVSDNNSDWDDVEGSEVVMGATESDQIAVVEMGNVAQAYARVTVTRTVADSTVDGIIAVGTSPGISPIANHASVGASVYLGSAVIGTP
ncbi:unnamed protein product [marine sediment metagenome]|uniref:DUF2190 domain-containing protein n=1 Tax=marine sediment metagenome TaxID=412755 RepID=X0SI16_9ZZZZ